MIRSTSRSPAYLAPQYSPSTQEGSSMRSTRKKNNVVVQWQCGINDDKIPHIAGYNDCISTFASLTLISEIM